MKKITCYITILAVILLLCACDYTQSGLTAEEYIEWEDEQTLGYINEILGTDYESFEQALDEQISIYEAKSSTDNLCKVCFVISEKSPDLMHDKIIQYYGELFDNIAQDKETYEYINNNREDTFKSPDTKCILMHNYLAALYESGMKDKFKNTASNLDLYFSDPGDIIHIAGEFFEGFLLYNDDATDEDFRLFLGELLECEQKYADKVDIGHQSYLAMQICYCAHKLGETKLAEEYNKKWSELDKALTDNH